MPLITSIPAGSIGERLMRSKTKMGNYQLEIRNDKLMKKKYWSGRVTRNSNALDLERGVFTFSNPRRIARSLKRSAERSKRRKSDPFRSAMSMLNFYINRAGKNLPVRRKKVLEQTKTELRRLF